MRVSDRVRVYENTYSYVGHVVELDLIRDRVLVDIEDPKYAPNQNWVHRKQCRKLVKKPKRRIFLSTNVVNTVFSADHHGIDFNVVSIGKVPWDHSCVEFVEVIRKK